MDLSIEQALGLLNITNVEDKGTLKKVYRKLMKENHPDAGGSDELSAKLNKAYDILNIAFDNGYFDSKVDLITKSRPDIDMSGYVSREIPVVKIGFMQLDKVLNKEEITIELDGKQLNLTKGMLDRCKILISDVIYIVDSRGKERKYRLSVAYKYGNRELNCNVIIEDLEELGENLEIKLSGKVIRVGRLSNNSSLSYKFDNYLVNITIVR